MAGVAGPYQLEGERVVAGGAATFSHLEPFERRTADEHVDRVHDAAVRKGRLLT
jgi:hypothetical protein